MFWMGLKWTELVCLLAVTSMEPCLTKTVHLCLCSSIGNWYKYSFRGSLLGYLLLQTQEVLQNGKEKRKKKKISYNMGKNNWFYYFPWFFFYFEELYPSISAYHNVNPPSFKSLNFKIPLYIKKFRTLVYTTAWCIFTAWGTTQVCLKAAELQYSVKCQAGSSSYAQLCFTSVKHLRRG